jgi:hypothetical protein
MSMQNVLNGSQSMSQASNIGTWSSSIPYQAIPCGGVNISSLFPSIGSGSFPYFDPNPFMGGVVLWVENFNMLACHLLQPHSCYMVGS